MKECHERTFLAVPRFEGAVVFFAGAAALAFAGAAFFAAGFLAAAALGAAAFLVVEAEAFAVFEAGLDAVLDAGFLVAAVFEAGLALVAAFEVLALGLAAAVVFALEAGLVFSFAGPEVVLVLGASLTRPEGPDDMLDDDRCDDQETIDIPLGRTKTCFSAPVEMALESWETWAAPNSSLYLLSTYFLIC